MSRVPARGGRFAGHLGARFGALFTARFAARFAARYGSSPAHLIGLLASFALAGYAALQLPLDRSAVRIVVWFVGVAVLHDLVFFPLYSLVDRSLSRRLGNYIRVPGLFSGLLLLIFWPSITRHSEDSLRAASGLSQQPFLGRWLIITAILFAASAALYAVRRGRAGPAARPGDREAAHA